ncbi:spore coat associated protein CotJA [Ruminiclostridium papyrosolvens]|uniref:Spore coat associated protein CotJA n=1 Tax=Ruminiclostridium papyrosolvens C7 TaxID=1330534 RepID=U4QZE2_9FIRM|nr:spore coat associated protein CotJA [Ruminiclostridium papyrosolvens]EPR10244.1 hypothetical protein L323_14125 [Ruminiclostridium papyrosolvens C7]
MDDLVNEYNYQERDKSAIKPFNPSKIALAMAFVPAQLWETPYDVNEGLDRGTLFPSLDKPFLGGGNRYEY